MQTQDKTSYAIGDSILMSASNDLTLNASRQQHGRKSTKIIKGVSISSELQFAFHHFNISIHSIVGSEFSHALSIKHMH